MFRILAVLLLAGVGLIAHPGETDSAGGHHDWQNGRTHHYHDSGRGPYRPFTPAYTPPSWWDKHGGFVMFLVAAGALGQFLEIPASVTVAPPAPTPPAPKLPEKLTDEECNTLLAWLKSSNEEEEL